MARFTQPVGIENAYATALRQYARRLRRALNLILIPKVPRIVDIANRYRSDANEPLGRSWIELHPDANEPLGQSWIELLEDLLEETLGVVTGVQQEGLAAVIGRYRAELGQLPGPSSAEQVGVAAYAEQINRHNIRQVVGTISAVYGEQYLRDEPWLVEMLRVWESENLRLIKSIPTQYVSDLQGKITRAINEGQKATDLVDTIKATYDQPVNRAELIAQDQVGKLHSQLVEERMRFIGVKEYKWRGILDARERPEHRAREGKVFSWDNPPYDGHPGVPIRCRCYPEPIWPKRDDVKLA